MYKEAISFRMPVKTKAEILKNYCSKDYKMTDFINDAVCDYLDKKSGIDEKTLILEMLNKNYQQHLNLERDLNALFMLFKEFIKSFYLYHPEIDDDHFDGALNSAYDRQDRFLKLVKDNIMKVKKSFIYDLFGEDMDLESSDIAS